MAEKRGRTTPADTTRYLVLFDSLPIELSEDDPPAAELAATARARLLSACDALYLVTALRAGWPLATRDENLRAAALRVGCDLA